MTEIAAEYKKTSDADLIQLWSERSELTEDAFSALQHELAVRELTQQAADFRPPPPPVDNSARYDPPVETYGNISMLWWAVRELFLRNRTRHGISVPATVESTLRSRAGYRSAARAELRYSYEYRGAVYSGRAVRDFITGAKTADALAIGHRHGEQIAVLVDPNDPRLSYFPSGFGFVEAFVLGGISLFVVAFLLWVFGMGLVEHLRSRF